jgi:hypothetical protein
MRDSHRVIDRQNYGYTSEINAEDCYDRVMKLADALKSCLDDSVGLMDKYVEAAQNIASIERVFPYVQCWVVGYYWSERERWSGFWGCATEEQAQKIAEGLDGVPIGRSRFEQKWIVRLTGIQFGSLVKDTFTAEQAAERLSS